MRSLLSFFVVLLFLSNTNLLLAVDAIQNKITKKQQKQYRKNTEKKNKQNIKQYTEYKKIYNDCNGDVECIKFQFKKNHLDNNVDVNVVIKDIQDKAKIEEKRNIILIQSSVKQYNKNNNNGTIEQRQNKPNFKNNIQANKITKKQKKNIKKITKIEFLNDKQILDLIDEQQRMVITPIQIKVRTKNKGVPNVCLPQKPIASHHVNNVNKELEDTKKTLKTHIKKSLIENEVSADLVEYIDNHLTYVKPTAKKNTEITTRKMIDTINKYDVPLRIKTGIIYKKMYQEVLSDVEDLFLVDRNIILAIWAMETNYGLYIGSYDAFNALYSACMNASSLARLRYFEDNIIALAILVDKGYFKRDEISSFDGGLGGCQFMPDSVYKFAVSLDGGKTDIIGNNKDVLASIGNYLHSIGWRYGEGILTEVDVPENLDICLYGMNTVKTIAEWEKLGIKLNKSKIGEEYFYNKTQNASLIITDPNDNLEDKTNKRAFLVYDNYKVILGYNQYLDYGLTAGLIAEGLKDE